WPGLKAQRRRRLIFHHLPERPQVDYSIDLGNEIKIQEAGGQEKSIPLLAPKGLFSSRASFYQPPHLL
ncbi:MAG TPA: hypothetical protein VFM05_06855, partial [Candidatus Saccharimonadales bacterium]|nr:hypothetical protein [Candidatus Saccharimonadales bacterium]